MRLLKCKIFFEKSNFCPWIHEKTTQKSCLPKQKFGRFRNFLFTAQQPKWQKTYSKKWPIEQLYIELGLKPKLHMFYIEVLHLLCRCRKVAGTMQALLGGDEIYHYHSKLMMKVTLLSCNISIVKQDLGDYLHCFKLIFCAIFGTIHARRAKTV